MRVRGIVSSWVLAAASAWPALAATPPPRPDVLLVTIDTLRADALGFAGNRRVATPNLDRLAAAGRVFTDAHAHNVVTLPSHTNILTGLYPYQHGVRDNSGFALPADVPTLATVLHDAGYATGAFVGAYPLDSRYGLGRGFDVYDDRTTTGAGEEQLVLAERRGDEVVAAALAWWRAQDADARQPPAAPRRPRFLWVHLYDPHASYEPPEPFASRYAKEPYLGEVAAVDAFLGPLLLPHLEGSEPPCLIVVTGDHGESLGEHGEETHGLFAYEATLHVPLVLWGRGVAAGTDGRPARHVDLFPTMLAAAGVAPPAGGPPRPGRSLLQPWSDHPDNRDSADSYFEALSAALNRGWAPLRGLLRQTPDGVRKYIALPLPEAYDLRRDPGEARNLVDAERRAARAAFDALPAASAWPPPARNAVAGEEEARMLALGYAASVAPAKASFGLDDDPKRLVDLDRKIHQLVEAYGAGDVERAVTLARELVAARPMQLGHTLLANALLAAGRTGEALAAMEKARAAGLAADSLTRQLGLTLASVGRTAEAVAVLQPLADRGDLDATNNLALAHSEAGRQREAFATVQRVLARDADNAKAYELLGLVELRLGHWAQARDASRRAVQRRAGLARAWNNLGVASYQLGQVDAALDAWQQAVEHEPELWDALWNLGLKAAEAKRIDLALPALSRFAAEAPADRYGKERARARALVTQLSGG